MEPEAKPTVSRPLLLQRCLRGQCPNCGGKRLWRTALRLHERCPDCDMLTLRSDGFFLGALTVNYGVTAFVGLPLIMIGYALDWYGYRMAVALAVAVAIIIPLLIYRISWHLWLLGYYWLLLHELKANQSELIPVNEDE